MNSTHFHRNNILETIASISAVLWLLCIMNTVFAWFSFLLILRLLAVSGILLYSFLSNSNRVTKGRKIMAFFVFLYFIWAVAKTDHLLAYISISMTYVTLLCLLFWPTEMLEKIYKIFRVVVIFFAIGSVVVVILQFTKFLSFVPHFEMPSQSALHENRGDYYNIYIIFPVLITYGNLLPRACGMMEEPGHFSIVLGFIYLIDRYIYDKINPVIILGAIFTFSPVFFLIAISTEFLNFIRHWKWILSFLGVIVVTYNFAYHMLPSDIQNRIEYMTFERNQDSFEMSSKSGFIAGLNERADTYGINIYNQMSFDQKLFGDIWDNDIILSDYRGFILQMGLIGFVIIILVSIASLNGASLKLKISLFLTLLIILLHRSWFFLEPFPYFMSFLASSLYKKKKIEDLKNIGI